MRKLAWVAAFCVAAALPASAQDKAALQRLADEWAGAYNKGDTAAVGQMYLEDAVLLPPEAEMVKGRNPIQAFWKQEAERTGDLKVTIMEVRPLGSDAAHAIFTSTLRIKGQPPQEVPGKGAALLQKVGADWRIATHV